MAGKKRILTGDRPTGRLHIGHYFGSLQKRVEMQNSGLYDPYILIADVQALTDNFNNPDKVRKNVREVAMDYLSCGIDPEKSTIYIQSMIPEVAELTVFYSNLVTIARLERNPTVKTEIAQKKAIYNRYKLGFMDLPISLNPYDSDICEPNFWLSCLIIDKCAMCKQVRSEKETLYIKEKGKTCPTEVLETLAKYNVEGRPIWKPMHMQPRFRMNDFVTREGNGRGLTNAYAEGGVLGADGKALDVGMDIFHRGLCLPSDNKMTVAEQDIVIEIVRSCFE